MELFLMILMNLLVGACIGLTGIAGFLLPMFYTGFLGMSPASALAYSFAAFFISGILGSVNYQRSGNLELRAAGILSVGSFAGALLGVKLNFLIPEHIIKLLLYLVVLLSGISILIRSFKKKESAGSQTGTLTLSLKNICGFLLLGLSTGAVCAASGAGGPVLVMPLLTVIGFPVHTAVGISLFDSIFIALPAAFGYLRAVFSQTASPAETSHILLLLLALLFAHGIGVFWGSRNAVKINQELLKKIVAAASIVIACIKLLGI